MSSEACTIVGNQCTGVTHQSLLTVFRKRSPSQRSGRDLARSRKQSVRDLARSRMHVRTRVCVKRSAPNLERDGIGKLNVLVVDSKKGRTPQQLQGRLHLLPSRQKCASAHANAVALYLISQAGHSRRSKRSRPVQDGSREANTATWKT